MKVRVAMRKQKLMGLVVVLAVAVLGIFAPGMARADLSAVPNGGWDPAFSPDGGKIAFLSSTLHTPADLWVMNADGSEPRRLTRRGAGDFSWLADGRTIQFSTKRKGFGEVMTIDLDGGQATRVADLPPNASLPVYSPDGELFAITVAGAQNSRDLWIGTSDGKRLEAVTDKISVRSLFWGPDSRKIYYEAGKSYGTGIWEIDLSAMTSRALLNNFIGTPRLSAANGLIAFPYPDQPGQFSVHTMKLDGSDIKTYDSPRLPGRLLAWDAAGTGVYYLGQDLVAKASMAAEPESEDMEKPPAALHDSSAPESEWERAGVTSLWHLDFAGGVETRLSPPELHLTAFTLAEDGRTALLSGVLADSYAGEVFRFDLTDKTMTRLLRSRGSSWMPVATQDSTKIAFFTNKPGSDTLKVVAADGAELASHPGIVQEGDTRFSWLPGNDGLAFFSSRGFFAFDENGPIAFPNKKDHRTFLYADVSIQSDKVLLSSIPRYGEYPGLYLLEREERAFRQDDLRYPAAPEVAAEFYLQPKWSFDGQWIAFSDREDIWVMKADGSERRWITDYARKNAEGDGNLSLASHPVWSISGDMLCYTRMLYQQEGLVRELWVVRRDGSEPRLVFSEPVDSAFYWSLEESTNLPFFDVTDERLIFTALEDGLPNLFAVDLKKAEPVSWLQELAAKLDMFSSEAKNDKLQRLTDSGAIYPVLLFEDDLILYTSLEGNGESLWTMNSDGTGKKPLVIKEPVAVEAESGEDDVSGDVK
jgi:Tol biopolymer transport system component